MASKKIQSIRGMKDVLPGETLSWESFEETVRDWLRAYGYRNIRMPILESTELFKRSIGEVTDIVEKEMFTFVDNEKESLTLRPEGTASCVRALVQHGVLMSGGPQRLYYDGPMFRHERPQRGRYRQFHQVGVEAFGFSSPDIDAEHIVMCSRLWKKLDIRGVKLQLNTLGSSEARERYREKLVMYFNDRFALLDDDSRRRLNRNPLRILDSKNPDMQLLIQNAPQFVGFMDTDSLEHFSKVREYLDLNNVQYELNPRLVRGLDYYNNTVFEWLTDELGSQGAICAGGRYDGLVSQLGGPSTPACGFAIGIERVIELLKTQKSQIPTATFDVYVVRQGNSSSKFSWRVAEQLRDAHLSVIMHGGSGNMKSQLGAANLSGARFAVIIGDDEASAEVVNVKPLREPGEQKRVRIAEAIDLIKRGGK
jgi:histidyl-tRNA synthetase